MCYLRALVQVGPLAQASNQAVLTSPAAEAASTVASTPEGLIRRITSTKPAYSHSIVAGGLLLTSRTTRLMPRTSLVIRLEIFATRSHGRRAQSAVMPSRLSTARRTQADS